MLLKFASHSSGGKPHLLGISKRGDTYLRTLLIHGARAVIVRAKQGRLLARRHKNIEACALANHDARVACSPKSLPCKAGATMYVTHVPE